MTKRSDYNYDVRELVALPTKSLSNWKRSAQLRERLNLMRQWWGAGFEEDGILRLAMKTFVLPELSCRHLMRLFAEQLDTEADAWDLEPVHVLRHRHRVRLTHVYQLAVKEKTLTVAVRAAKHLADLDDVFSRPEDEAVRQQLSIHQQGARLLTNEQIAGLLTGKTNQVVIDVPSEPEEAPP